MNEYKYILGLLSVLIAVLSYYFYFHSILDHKTKPHAFSWFVWGTLMGISFFTQVFGGAGAGAWVVGFSALACFLISAIAFSRGLRGIKLIDWLSLIGAFFSLVIWYIFKEPVLSVILITITYSLGFFPTLRKSFKKPQDEALPTYLLNGVKFFISLFALNNLSFITAFYPATLSAINLSFALVLFIRSKQLNIVIDR